MREGRGRIASFFHATLFIARLVANNNTARLEIVAAISMGETDPNAAALESAVTREADVTIVVHAPPTPHAKPN
jgi:hypothetical protein